MQYFTETVFEQHFSFALQFKSFDWRLRYRDSFVRVIVLIKAQYDNVVQNGSLLHNY